MLIDKSYKCYCILSKWFVRPRVRFLALTIYYLAILAGLIALYGKGNFSTPPFIYQNF
jgi:D-Ala-teichoic acid biosynthesis protein